MIFAVGARTGGVAHVFGRVMSELRGRGEQVVSVTPDEGRSALLSAVGALWRHREALRGADHVHLEFGSNDLAAFWAAIIAVLVRPDCVVVVHDHPKVVHHAAIGLTGRARLPMALAVRVLSPRLDRHAVALLLRRAGHVLTFGEPARAALEAIGARRTGVIVHGSDPPPPGPPPSRGESILFAGFIGPSKGVGDLLAAWRDVGERVGLPLVLAGEPEQPWFDELMTGHADLPGEVRVLGPIADDDAFQRLIASAAVVVLPYTSSSPASGILIRALACGRAVCVTPVPAAREVIRDCENAAVVPMHDPAALGARLLELAGDPALRDRLGAAAATTAQRAFSWSRQADQLLDAYARSSRSSSSA